MKHTEEQIIKKAKQIIKDFRGKYYFKDCTDGVLFKENEKILYGKQEGEVISQVLQ